MKRVIFINVLCRRISEKYRRDISLPPVNRQRTKLILIFHNKIVLTKKENMAGSHFYSFIYLTESRLIS